MQDITYGNILAVFFSADEAEIQEGEGWYARGNMICRTLAARYGTEMHIVAGIIAALSPNNRWDRNVRDAEALLKAHTYGFDFSEIKVSTYGRNKQKAIDILYDSDPLNVLGGLKVRAFYHCLVGGDYVCVDGHAYAIWLGRKISTTEVPAISPGLYAKISDDYRQATMVINQVTGKCYLPSQVQAITWVAWRNRKRGVK